MTVTTFKPGDQILIPWGRDKVAGTVLSLFGSPGEQYARLRLEFPSDVEETEYLLLTASVTQLERVPGAKRRRVDNYFGRF